MTTPPSTDDDKTPPAADKGGGGDSAPTMGDLRAMVAETVEGALKPFMDKIGGGGGTAPAAGDKPAAAPATAAGGPDIARMVDEALAKVIGDRDKQTADDAHKKQHEQLAAAAERRPVERPRRSRWLGSIFDND